MSLKNKSESVVFIVAHPDDVAHSMGGTTLLLRKKGYGLHVFCATKGERGIRGKTCDEAARIREAEEAAVCRRLDASLTFLGQIDGEAHADRETCQMVADGLKRLQPKAIFTLWPINRHLDHVAAYDITMQALRSACLPQDIDVYMSENDIGVTRQFEPDILVDISDVIEEKKELVRMHKSQNPNEERVNSVIERNAFRAKFTRCAFVEAFKMMSPVTAYQSGHVAGEVLINIRAKIKT